MKLQLVCLRDIRLDEYGNMYCVPLVGMAVRNFGDEVNRVADDNVLYKHGDDFELFHFGEFDTSTGIFDLLARPRQVAIGKDMKRVNGKE